MRLFGKGLRPIIGRTRVKGFPNIHDVILVYSKTASYVFNPQYTPLTKAYIDSFYKYKDENGRIYRLSDLTARGIRNGESGKPWHGLDPSQKGNHWVTTVSNLDKLEKEGHIYLPKKAGAFPYYKLYLDETTGQLVNDIWMDIPNIQAQSENA